MDITMQLKAISEPNRYKIINLLLERHYCVRIIAKKLNISESAVSQHMSVLKEAGIVYGKKLGYHMHYIVKTDTLRYIRDEMSNMLQAAEQSALEIKNCSCELSREKIASH
ncbi:ArsR/SmtB family transcription factor [Anaerocolumna sp. MB42-C2]|uniref:ArsR/SmtB family transcription factor n=1 Tax=Anaerocolumna sp. MB42-C2 TaxID=3070997 RepID=UPI0027DF1C31|nr:metalloregulator ArsR/SmtB family transcription factor [Anaerocolumna sp. MB42-C2]WMJ89963.1 metalloregulator ArsR/SmtB family transcription factor [Anaerocolumna sp. MB42-C2]